MQVTNNQNLPPAGTQPGVQQAIAKVSEKPPKVENSSPAKVLEPAKALEKALVQAAGLKPAEAAGVRVSLAVDKEHNRVIARVIDKESGELILQIPSDQVLRNAAAIRDLLGAALNTQA